jgi:hypothetical protein
LPLVAVCGNYTKEETGEMKKPVDSLLTTIWSDLRTISKTVRTVQSHVEKKWRDYAVTLIIELVATAAGVFLGLYCSDRWQ